MKLLDLYCKAGGAGMGYHLAGFDVVGVDIEPQPNYPFEFHQSDALEYLHLHAHEFGAIHASPPCQFATTASQVWRSKGKQYENLIPATREALKQTGLPYVIENVPGAAKWLINPVVLNGAMFGMLVHRERLFECSFEVPLILLPQLVKPVKMGRPVKDGDVIQPVGNFSGVEYARKQMGISWMSQRELAQAIPPAYTKYIGGLLLANTALLSNKACTRQVGTSRQNSLSTLEAFPVSEHEQTPATCG
jgi:DNA (cytosine-5)-methyltransferase 1